MNLLFMVGDHRCRRVSIVLTKKLQRGKMLPEKQLFVQVNPEEVGQATKHGLRRLFGSALSFLVRLVPLVGLQQ